MTTVPQRSKRRETVTPSTRRAPLRRTVAHRTIDSTELAERLADGESCASVARDFKVAPSTVSRQARLPEVVDEVEKIIEHRSRLVARLRVSHAAAVFDAAAKAARGQWSPDAAQLELIWYFLKCNAFDGPGVAPTEVHVHLGDYRPPEPRVVGLPTSPDDRRPETT